MELIDQDELDEYREVDLNESVANITKIDQWYHHSSTMIPGMYPTPRYEGNTGSKAEKPKISCDCHKNILQKDGCNICQGHPDWETRKSFLEQGKNTNNLENKIA